MAGSPDLTPGQAMRLAKVIADVYADATAELVRVVARQVNRGLTRDGSTAAAQLSELVKLRDQAQRVVVSAQAKGGREAVALIETAYRGGLRASPAGLVAVNQRSVRAIALATLGELDQAGPQMLRWADDVYRRVTAETLPLAVTGAVNRREVTARALDRYAAMGVTGFTDRTGGNWRIEAYAEMATRTGLQRAHLAGTIDRITGQGADLVLVTTSPAGCPICRPYEARVFSISGTDPDHPPLQTAIAGGLFHPNCTHTVNRYVEGLTRVRDADELRVTDAPEVYEMRQRERALVRRVQESRRRVAAAKELGQTNVLTQQEALLARRLDALKRHRRGETTAEPAAALQGMAAHADLSGGYAQWLEANGTDLQKQAFERYTRTSAYQRWNPHLRGQGGDVEATDLAQIEALTDLIDESDGLTQSVQVWRGVKDADGVFGAQMPAGHVFTDKAFVSTTMDDSIRDYYRGEGGAVVEIIVPKGTKVAVAETEGQIVLAPGTRLRIVSDETVERIKNQADYDYLKGQGLSPEEFQEKLDLYKIMERSRTIRAEVVQ